MRKDPFLSLFTLSVVIFTSTVFAAEPIPGTISADKFNGLCLDIEGVNKSENAQLLMWNCKGSNNQLFTVNAIEDRFQFRLEHSNKCLAVENGSQANNARIVQRTCNGTDLSTQWKIDGNEGNHLLIAAHSGKCLNIKGKNEDRGAVLVQWPCQANQLHDRWAIDATIPSITKSAWEGPYDMPIVAGAAANLPDGKIVTWSAWAKARFTNSPLGRTQTSIFNPITKQSTERLVSNTDHDMFCPGTAQLPDGRILVTGGNDSEASSIYDPAIDQWSATSDMNVPRGYHAMTVLSNGSVLTVGGSWSGGKFRKPGEVWDPVSNIWQEKQGLDDERLLTKDSQGIFRSDNHMWIFSAPNGEVFHAGPSVTMNWLDTNGDGAVQSAGDRADDDHAMNGNAVMYDVGKILTLGGAPDYQNSDASKRAYTIDINGGPGAEIVNSTGDMQYARAFHNSVVLPSGEVVVIGGQEFAVPFSDDKSVLVAEIWNPNSNEFRSLGSMRVPRNYHSVALLMKDGRIFVAGGGLCNKCSTNHEDAEIFTPPYLLNDDDSLATRPTLSDVPTNANPGDIIKVQVDTDVEHNFTLIRMAAATHAVNNDERRIPLTATRIDGNNFNLELPTNSAVLLPGNYFLFAMDDRGVPSIAETINISTDVNPNNGFEAAGTIVATNNGNLCLDIEGRRKTNGTRMITWACNGQDNQEFSFRIVNGKYQFRANHSNKCLGVENANTQKRASVVQMRCEVEDHQLWELGGVGDNRTLRAVHSDMCLNISSGGSVEGLELIQWPCRNKGNEKFRIDALLP